MRKLNLSNQKTAIYCRLSREDGNEESQSIQAQQEILTKYVEEQGWDIIDIYKDDGYSGTSFDRPDFQRLLNDIELGKIDIVITKDLSRLGRNYIQTGYYTEEYFPANKVRYIALNDNFDTANEDSNDFAPFKNIINEWYAKDISKKIRFTLDSKAKRGEPRNTVFPIFGYTYNENFERIPDPDTAPIVQFIFKEYVKTGSSYKVAQILTAKRVKLPRYFNAIKYNYNKQKVLSMSEEELTNWTSGGVRDILVRDDYIGNYTTARSKSTNYKMKKRTDNENCYVFENRYEPLIDRETFEIANKLLKRTRSGAVPFKENIYKGLILCADCGKPLKYERKRNPKTKEFDFYRYYCNNKSCKFFNAIQVENLNKVIKMEILNLKNIILNHKEEFIEFAKNFDSKGRTLELDSKKELALYIKKSNEIDNYIQKLFEQNVEGIIPQSTFDNMMAKYNRDKRFVEQQIVELTKLEQKQLSEKFSDNKLNSLISMLENINEDNVLDIELLHSLIYAIHLHSTKVNPKSKKFTYIITIRYSVLDDIIKEFMTYEKAGGNIC